MIDGKYGDLGSVLDEEALDVALFRGDQHAAVPVDGNTAIDLHNPAPLAREVAVEIIDSTVRLQASADVPSASVDLLRQTPVPPAFHTVPWLRDHRAVVLHNDRFVVGTFVLTYDPDLGLCVQEAGDR